MPLRRRRGSSEKNQAQALVAAAVTEDAALLAYKCESPIISAQFAGTCWKLRSRCKTTEAGTLKRWPPGYHRHGLRNRSAVFLKTALSTAPGLLLDKLRFGSPDGQHA